MRRVILGSLIIDVLILAMLAYGVVGADVVVFPSKVFRWAWIHPNVFQAVRIALEGRGTIALMDGTLVNVTSFGGCAPELYLTREYPGAWVWPLAEPVDGSISYTMGTIYVDVPLYLTGGGSIKVEDRIMILNVTATFNATFNGYGFLVVTVCDAPILVIPFYVYEEGVQTISTLIPIPSLSVQYGGDGALAYIIQDYIVQDVLARLIDGKDVYDMFLNIVYDNVTWGKRALWWLFTQSNPQYIGILVARPFRKLLVYTSMGPALNVTRLQGYYIRYAIYVWLEAGIPFNITHLYDSTTQTTYDILIPIGWELVKDSIEYPVPGKDPLPYSNVVVSGIAPTYCGLCVSSYTTNATEEMQTLDKGEVSTAWIATYYLTYSIAELGSAGRTLSPYGVRVSLPLWLADIASILVYDAHYFIIDLLPGTNLGVVPQSVWAQEYTGVFSVEDPSWAADIVLWRYSVAPLTVNMVNAVIAASLSQAVPLIDVYGDVLVNVTADDIAGMVRGSWWRAYQALYEPAPGVNTSHPSPWCSFSVESATFYIDTARFLIRAECSDVRPVLVLLERGGIPWLAFVLPRVYLGSFEVNVTYNLSKISEPITALLIPQSRLVGIPFKPPTPYIRINDTLYIAMGSIEAQFYLAAFLLPGFVTVFNASVSPAVYNPSTVAKTGVSQQALLIADYWAPYVNASGVSARYYVIFPPVFAESSVAYDISTIHAYIGPLFTGFIKTLSGTQVIEGYVVIFAGNSTSFTVPVVDVNLTVVGNVSLNVSTLVQWGLWYQASSVSGVEGDMFASSGVYNVTVYNATVYPPASPALNVTAGFNGTPVRVVYSNGVSMEDPEILGVAIPAYIAPISESNAYPVLAWPGYVPPPPPPPPNETATTTTTATGVTPLPPPVPPPVYTPPPVVGGPIPPVMLLVALAAIALIAAMQASGAEFPEAAAHALVPFGIALVLLGYGSVGIIVAALGLMAYLLLRRS